MSALTSRPDRANGAQPAVWDDVYGFDFTCIKEIALKEPLVDTVEIKAVNTQACPIKTIDLLTVTKEELAFTAPFTLRATRKDC